MTLTSALRWIDYRRVRLAKGPAESEMQECQRLSKLHTWRDSFRLPERTESVRTIWRRGTV